MEIVDFGSTNEFRDLTLPIFTGGFLGRDKAIYCIPVSTHVAT